MQRLLKKHLHSVQSRSLPSLTWLTRRLKRTFICPNGTSWRVVVKPALAVAGKDAVTIYLVRIGCPMRITARLSLRGTARPAGPIRYLIFNLLLLTRKFRSQVLMIFALSLAYLLRVKGHAAVTMAANAKIEGMVIPSRRLELLTIQCRPARWGTNLNRYWLTRKIYRNGMLSEIERFNAPQHAVWGRVAHSGLLEGRRPGGGSLG
jgi:hypothetical protein